MDAQNDTRANLVKALQALQKTRQKLEKLEAARHEPIAVIGMACRFPGADSPEAFWEMLAQGRDMVQPIPSERWDNEACYHPTPGTPGASYVREAAFIDQPIDQFDPQFFGISPREALHMDPQQRLLLEVSWEALERAGLAPAALKNSRTSVFVGVTPSEYVSLFDEQTRFDTYATTGNGAIFASGRLGYVLGLQGPNLVVDTACSASLIGVHLACESLRNGSSDLALAGGSHLMVSPQGHIAQSQMQALAPDGRCKTFDAAANGYGRGEGCGVVVLRRLSDALAQGDSILALIRGSAINHDGPSSGLTVPSVTAQAALIREALANGKVDAGEVSYVEAHGTGTRLGDPIEVRALGLAYGQRATPLLVGSLKTNIGHLEEAAGIAGLMKVVLALQYGAIPPHRHFHHPNPHIDWADGTIRVPSELTPWDVPRRLAGVSSFGLGGSNAHVILEEAPPPAAAMPEDERPWHLLTLSARSQGALRALAQRYQEALRAQPAVALGDLCATAYCGRNHFNHRLSLTTSSLEQIQTQLAAYNEDPHAPGCTTGVVSPQQAAPRLAFLFTGQGAQYVGMGRELYATEPTFRTVIDRCDAVMLVELGRSLVELLYPVTAPQHNDLLESHPCGQAANFALECALSDLWRSWGIHPTVVLGHSLGDFAAAYTAGVIGLEDGLRLVVERGRLMEHAVGSMLSVIASEAEVLPFIVAYADVTVGVINGPRSVVLSGGHNHIALVSAALVEAGFTVRQLAIPMAAHSPLLDPVLDAFEAAVRTVKLALPQIAVISSMTGQAVAAELTDPLYWRRHLRDTVRFADGVATLHALGCTAFVEIGPQATLLGMAGQVLDALVSAHGPMQAAIPLMIPSLREGQSDWQQLLTSLGALYTRGVMVDWQRFDGQRQRRKVMLPTYPFQRSRHWIDRPAGVPARPATGPATAIIEQLQQGDEEQLVAALSTAALSAAGRTALPEIVALLVAQQRQQARDAALDDWLYEVVWRPLPAVAAQTSATGAVIDGRHWLIFADASGLGEALANQLRRRGEAAICVFAGDAYRADARDCFILDPHCPQDYRRLLATLPALHGIVHLWSLDGPADDPLVAARHGCGSALQLVQALGQLSTPPPGLWLITRDAQAARSTDQVAGVTQAPIWGLGRVITLEHPELCCVCIDLDHASSADVLAAAVMSAAPDRRQEDQIAFRGGARYGARLVRYQGEKAAARPVVRADATYLITGGLGGLGLVVAEWLAQQGARRLVLMGRSSPTPTAQQQIEAIAALGATVTVAQADVNDRSQVAATMAQIDPAYPLAGVVHAAAAREGGSLLQLHDWERFAAILSPKLAGAWHLEELTSTTVLDFFICFSSITTLAGDIGLGAYVAANSFLDAFAHYRRARQRPALSVNWGIWAEVGAAASMERSRQLEDHGHGRITPDQGIAALARLLRTPASRVAVMPIDWDIFGSRAASQVPLFTELTASHRPRVRASDVLANESVESTSPSLSRRFAQTPPEQRASFLARHVGGLVVQVLGLPSSEALDCGESLLGLGLDSLMAVELRNHLRQGWGVAIPFVSFLAGLTTDDIIAELLRRLDLTPGHRDLGTEVAFSPVSLVGDATDQDGEFAWITGKI
nr:type I polyketide synthase [Candidatus Chloroploca sp. Khr17]